MTTYDHSEKNYGSDVPIESSNCSACGRRPAAHIGPNTRYCDDHKTFAAHVTRFVLTYVKRVRYKTNDPLSQTQWSARMLMEGQQGRYTYATREEAETRLRAIQFHNSDFLLESIWGDDPDFQVMECPCWPGHFDPRQIIFDI